MNPHPKKTPKKHVVPAAKRMMYRYPGSEIEIRINGKSEKFDYITVPESATETYLDKGWFCQPWDAKETGNKPKVVDIKPKPKPKRKVRNPISNQTKVMIASASGTTREIAKRFDVSTATVQRIKNEAKKNGVDKKAISIASA